MKIVFIATEKLPVPPIRGGAIQIYLESVAATISKKHDVTILSVQDPELPNIESRNGVTYIHFSKENYLPEIIEHLRMVRYDVVHICNRPLWVREIRKVAVDAQIVLSVHNEMFAEEKISFADGLECIHETKKIVTVSDYIGTTIYSRFPSAKQKVKTVYSGVDLQTFHPKWTQQGAKINESIRKELGLKNEKVILFVGRLSKVKGPHILLQAIPNIITEHPEARMVFVGSKWFSDNQVNHFVRHLYTVGAMYKDYVKFIQFVQPKDIPSLFAMADVFVCSSQWQEPLARVHYEAMAAGVPIITSRRGGNPEVIEHEKNGYVVDDFANPEAYAKWINALFTNPSLMEKMGRYGRTKAEKEFSWNVVASNLLSVYEE
ncbi:spore coat protein SA [Anoxybacillus tepidamans]|uniref:Spore coat protein SA n=1 Tax=Anoxybacteroides tepidamans TaxID=265948 RepID=A0A7W8IRX7_9BACL|nr:glycosyltransferase family 4 protein [Anoxybacillus tepidamans]MBB5325534.1 spore coat protein SA [Anoxybacillus tepidamans]